MRNMRRDLDMALEVGNQGKDLPLRSQDTHSTSIAFGINMQRFGLFLLLFVLIAQTHAGAFLEQVASWRLLNFGNVDSRDSVPIGIAVTNDRIFVSMPRLRENAPMTLGWIPRVQQDVEPLIVPFPDWSWQSGHRDNCTGMVSVFRSRVDSCGRLWVLDSGTVNTSTRVCPARLFVFDPHTGTPLRVLTIPPELLRQNSVLPFLEFEHDPTPLCDAMHVYISDALGYGLIVLEASSGTFWRFDHETFRNEPRFGTFQVAGETGTTQDGILGLAVAHLAGQSMLFYRPFSSITMYAVPTAALRYPTNHELPVLKVLDQSSQGVAMAAHGNRVLFSPLSESSLISLDTSTLYVKELTRELIALQFVPDIFVDKAGDIWLLSNRFQRFSAMAYNPAEINFRILRIRGSSAFIPSLPWTPSLSQLWQSWF